MTQLYGLDTLDSIAEYLNGLITKDPATISPRNQGEEGREASSRHEREIKQRIAVHFKECENVIDGFNLSIPTANRFWYDFALTSQEKNFLVPVNIKSTTGSSPDNCGSKEGVYYSLTGQLPNNAVCREYDSYFRALGEGIREALSSESQQTKDYYFLIYLRPRAGTPRFFVQTLKSIKTLTPNGSNPPFQCSWGHNEQRVVRSFSGGVLNALSAYQQAMALRAAQYSKFQEALDPLITELRAQNSRV